MAKAARGTFDSLFVKAYNHNLKKGHSPTVSLIKAVVFLQKFLGSTLPALRREERKFKKNMYSPAGLEQLARLFRFQGYTYSQKRGLVYSSKKKKKPGTEWVHQLAKNRTLGRKLAKYWKK
jgi:hypothetical protein